HRNARTAADRGGAAPTARYVSPGSGIDIRADTGPPSRPAPAQATPSAARRETPDNAQRPAPTHAPRHPTGPRQPTRPTDCPQPGAACSHHRAATTPAIRRPPPELQNPTTRAQ